MNEAAYILGDTVIYWNSIMIGFGVLAAFFIGLAFYMVQHKFAAAYVGYTLFSVILSVFFARLIHWYCNMEHYESFQSAFTNFDSGGYSILGVFWGTWVSAALISLLPTVPSRFSLLDTSAPGLAFLLAMIRFSDIYSNACRGKFSLVKEQFFDLPFGMKMEIGGVTEYRFAAFFISFIFLIIIMFATSIFQMTRGEESYRDKVPAGGHTYRFFLLLFSMTELVIDSIRYDSLHLFFYGEKLADLNKAASFIGLSQLAAAVTLLYLMIYYFVLAVKTRGKKAYRIGMLVGSIAGLIIAGVCEYLVQRYTGMYVEYYFIMSLGVLTMGACILGQYSGLLKKNK